MGKIISFRKNDVPASLSSSASQLKPDESLLPASPNTLLIPEGKTLPPVSRLVVLVPDAEVDELKFSKTIWALAAPRQIPVLFLGLCCDPASEFTVRRRLTNLGVMTRDHCVPVETRLRNHQDWIQAVREFWRPGDLVICHAEQNILRWGFWRQPLGPVLVAAFGAPICTLTGLYLNLSSCRPSQTHQLVSLTMSLITIVAFFGIEAWVHQQTISWGWVSTALLIFLVLIEFGLIWFWNIHLG